MVLDGVNTVSFAHLIADGNAKGPNPNETGVFYDGEISKAAQGAPVELKLALASDSGAYEGTVDGGKTKITLPVTAIEDCDIDRKALQRIFPNWGAGRFDQAFPDLAKALGSFYEISMEDMKDRLVQEAGKGGESFEVFGLKLPVG